MRHSSRLLALASLAITTHVSAQSWEPLQIPEGGSLQRYYEVGGALIASASMNTYRTTNGSSWTAIGTLPPMITLNSGAVIGNTIVGLFPGAGIYSSTDAGITWEQTADAATTATFNALVPAGSAIFARTNSSGLMRSTDLGQTWTPVTLPPDSSVSQVGSDATHITIADFAGLQTSSDLGETWQPAFTLPPSSMIELYPANASVQFAFIRDFINQSNTLNRSTDGGVTWNPVASAPADLQGVESIQAYAGGLLALVRTGSGSYFPIRSIDNGLNWTSLSTPSGEFVSAIGTLSSSIFLSGQQGPYRSDNLGGSWVPSRSGTYSVAVNAVVSSANAAYAADRSTLIRSLNATSWEVHSLLPAFISFLYSTGSGIHEDQDEVFASLLSAGLYRSTDGGATFLPVNNGIPQVPLSAGTIRSVVDLVRVNPTTLIIAVAGSSRPGRHGVGGSTFGAEGFIRTTNNGASWSQSNSGFPTIGINEVFQPNWDQITNLAVLPPSTVIATTRTLGVWRSTNSGASWSQANTGVPTCGGVLPTFADAIVQGSDVFLSIDSLGSGCLTLPTQILKSTDAGATWSFASTGMPASARGGRMSVTGSTLNVLVRPTLGSLPVIYQSTDAGATWVPAPSPHTPLTAPQAIGDSFVAGTTFFGLWAMVPPPPCAGDANDDALINAADLSVLLAQFNASVKPGSGADFNNDGIVNGADLSVLLGIFGSAC